MRFIKTFALAVLTAALAMAFAGASTAMGMNTAICASNEGGTLTCAPENQFANVHAVANGVKILSSIGTVECEKSLLAATLGKLAAPQVGTTTSLTWEGNCHLGKIACTVSTTSLGIILFLKTAVNLGEMQFHEMTVFIKCGVFISCHYEGLPTFHLVGASEFGDGAGNGGVESKKVTLKGPPTDDLCPESIFLDLFWEASEPVYIKS